MRRKKQAYNAGDLWRGKHIPIEMRKKESETKKLFFQLGITKPTWFNKHLSEETRQKISKTKLKLFREGKTSIGNTINKTITNIEKVNYTKIKEDFINTTNSTFKKFERWITSNFF